MRTVAPVSLVTVGVALSMFSLLVSKKRSSPVLLALIGFVLTGCSVTSPDLRPRRLTPQTVEPTARGLPPYTIPAQPAVLWEKQSPKTITVQHGDTLYGLGRKYGTTVEKIMVINRLATSKIIVGQQLKLPTQ